MVSEPNKSQEQSSPTPPSPGFWSKIALWWLAKYYPEGLRDGQDGSSAGTFAASTDAKYDKLAASERPGLIRRWLWGLLDPDRSGARYRQLEEWSWRGEEGELRNLAWLLRAKHEEAAARSRTASRIGAWLTGIAVLLSFGSVGAAVLGWHKIISLLSLDPAGHGYRVPEHLWIVVVATTAAVLLVGAAATLLFKVAAQAYERGARFAGDADHTRQIEAAVRLVLATRAGRPATSRAGTGVQVGDDAAAAPESDANRTLDAELRVALIKLASELLERAPERARPKEETDLSALPDLVKELLELALKARQHQ